MGGYQLKKTPCMLTYYVALMLTIEEKDGH